MKIGVYGGTFNPPHLGHVTAARAVSELLKLDKLLFIPAGLPPHKPLPEGTPSPEQRLEMTRLAAENCDFLVSIPMRGRLNSLNASAAAAILLYEAVRQRMA